MIRFFSIFFVLLITLFSLELTAPAQAYLVQPWTNTLAIISGSIASLFDSTVDTYGRVIINMSTGRGVSIEAGCNGIEAVIVLIAAISAFPSTIRMKLIGIFLGFVAIQALNVVRVISLYYLSGWSPDLFEFAHLYLWQALIMIDVLVVWLFWIRHAAGAVARPEDVKA